MTEKNVINKFSELFFEFARIFFLISFFYIDLRVCCRSSDIRIKKKNFANHIRQGMFKNLSHSTIEFIIYLLTLN